MKYVNYRDAGLVMPTNEEWQRIRQQQLRIKKLDAHAAIKQKRDGRPRLRKKA
jgi:hypothetical protein